MIVSTETFTAPSSAGWPGEQRLILDQVAWPRYVAMSDAMPEHSGAKLVYLDGRLAFVTASRRHDFLADCLSDFVKAIALATGIGYSVAGRSTFRKEERGAGVEGDQTFYFRENARTMLGGVNIDLAAQPPPDLAIEVEVSNPADLSVIAWGRLGVPEVWRFKVETWEVLFLARRADGSYSTVAESPNLAGLTPDDVRDQMRAADKLETATWYEAMRAWVRDVLIPRRAGGA